jgi:hypothetical protein
MTDPGRVGIIGEGKGISSGKEIETKNGSFSVLIANSRLIERCLLEEGR